MLRDSGIELDQVGSLRSFRFDEPEMGKGSRAVAEASSENNENASEGKFSFVRGAQGRRQKTARRLH